MPRYGSAIREKFNFYLILCENCSAEYFGARYEITAYCTKVNHHRNVGERYIFQTNP